MKMKKLPFAEPKPKVPHVEKMCERCPFRPDGSGYAQDHPDLPRIKEVAELGLPFYCHETVIFDPRTKLVDGEPVPNPQPHFEGCRGAWEYRLEKWRERAEAWMKGRKK